MIDDVRLAYATGSLCRAFEEPIAWKRAQQLAQAAIAEYHDHPAPVDRFNHFDLRSAIVALCGVQPTSGRNCDTETWDARVQLSDGRVIQHFCKGDSSRNAFAQVLVTLGKMACDGTL